MNVKDTIEQYNNIVDKIKLMLADIGEMYKNRVNESNDILLDQEYKESGGSLFYRNKLSGRALMMKRLESNPFFENKIDVFGDGDFEGYAYFTENNTIKVYGYSEPDSNGHNDSESVIELPIELIEAEGDKYIELLTEYVENKFFLNLLLLENEDKVKKEKEMTDKEATIQADRKALERLKSIYPEEFK